MEGSMDREQLKKSIEMYFDSDEKIEYWMRNERITSFGNLTPNDIIEKYGEDVLIQYISDKSFGAFE